jgi:hypothetical protein
MKDTPLYARFRRIRHRIKRIIKRRKARLPWIGRAVVHRRLTQRYVDAFGVPPRLDPPISHNEHILHRSLYDRDPMLRVVTDKIAVREIIAERVGPEAVVPTLGVWSRVEDIDWERLPNAFALKPNHASGTVALVRSAAERDPAALATKARSWLNYDYFDYSHEWGYRDMDRVVIAEPLLTCGGAAPVEAQVFTFQGKAALVRVLCGPVATDDRTSNWFTLGGERLPYVSAVRLGDHDLARAEIERLVPMAERAAVGFRQLRVDFYLTDDGPKIGELTPYHGGGFTGWNDDRFNHLLGRLWSDRGLLDRVAGASADEIIALVELEAGDQRARGPVAG